MDLSETDKKGGGGGGGGGGGERGSLEKSGIPMSSSAEEGTRAESASLSSVGEVEEFAQKFVDERIASALYKIPDASDVAAVAHEEGTGGAGGGGGLGKDVDGEEEEGGVTEEAFEEDFEEEAADEEEALADEHGVSGLRTQKEEEEEAVRRPGVRAQGALSDAGLDGAHAGEALEENFEEEAADRPEADEIAELEKSIASKAAEMARLERGDEDFKPPTPPLPASATSRPAEAEAGGRERGGEGEGEGRDASKKAEAPVSKAVVEEGGGERRRRSDGAAREDGAGGGEAVAAGDIEAQNAAATKIQSRARGMQASMPHTQSPVNTSSFS